MYSKRRNVILQVFCDKARSRAGGISRAGAAPYIRLTKRRCITAKDDVKICA